MSATSLSTTGNPSLSIQEVTAPKWPHIVLVTGAVALLIIGILATLGILDGMGTTNATYLSYGMYGGAAFFALAEVGILICNHYYSERPSSKVEESRIAGPRLETEESEKKYDLFKQDDAALTLKNSLQKAIKDIHYKKQHVGWVWSPTVSKETERQLQEKYPILYEPNAHGGRSFAKQRRDFTYNLLYDEARDHVRICLVNSLREINSKRCEQEDYLSDANERTQRYLTDLKAHIEGLKSNSEDQLSLDIADILEPALKSVHASI